VLQALLAIQLACSIYIDAHTMGLAALLKNMEAPLLLQLRREALQKQAKQLPAMITWALKPHGQARV
jgi:hypothetical protein